MNDETLTCRDIRDRVLIKDALDCTKARIVKCFEAIPDDALCEKLLPELSPAAWIFGHIVTTERAHIGGFAQGLWDIPQEYRILDSCASVPTEKDLMDCIGSKGEIIAYWDSVREQTHEYLATLSDEEMSGLPTHSWKRFCTSPVREFLAMTIHHPNYHFCQLCKIAEMNGIETDI